MSLFVINRYEGETEKSTDEKKHLSELLKRIEERKREREKLSQKNQSQSISEKKNVNASIRDNRGNDNQLKDGEQTNDQQKVRGKKRKKKRNVQNIDSTINEEFETSMNDRLQNANDDQKDQEKVTNEKGGFIPLGVYNKKKKHEVKRVLPDWLANPNVISMNLNSGPSLDELKSILDSSLIKVLEENGVTKLFPVQAAMMTWLLKCNKDRELKWWLRDTCVSAPTGSGKTLAYVLPIIQTLHSRLVPKIRCLIVVPVHELALQVHKVVVKYTSYTDLRVALLSGASPFEQEQCNIVKKTGRGEYVSRVDIVVATPGRLIDHILKTTGFSLDHLRFLVIDEADKATDWMEFLPEPHYRAPLLTPYNMRHSKIPAQKLLFSATLSQDPEKLNRLGLFQPILFTSVPVSGKDGDINLDKEMQKFVGRYTCPEELTEQAVECEAEYKPVALYHLLISNDTILKTLVFTNSRETAHRLSILLRSFFSGRNVLVEELSASLTPKERENVLQNFSIDKIQILVCSDALARGIDVPDVQIVISYDFPKHIKCYIHRAGRTGRAGKSGIAISILSSKQVGLFKHMLSTVHKTVPDIEKLELESVAKEIDYPKHIDELKRVLKEEKQQSLSRVKSVKRVKYSDTNRQI